MNIVEGFRKDSNIGAAVEKEGEFLGNLVANGIAGAGIRGDERDAHGSLHGQCRDAGGNEGDIVTGEE
jgi:hypothetical protein